MRETGRSGCPINLTLEILGDRWSLIVLRDIMFGNRRHFREMLAKSDEGIASNILADRLKRLVEKGLLSRRDDASHKQKAIYSLTEMGIALVPVFAAMGEWGRNFLPVTEELDPRRTAQRRRPGALGALHAGAEASPSRRPQARAIRARRADAGLSGRTGAPAGHGGLKPARTYPRMP